MSLHRHSEPVTDVTGVGIRILTAVLRGTDSHASVSTGSE